MAQKAIEYEKLDLFYLGKTIDPHSKEQNDELLLIKNKNLTTHAAIIGMTGSGKTGLGISIIEEAILDNIPSIIIDPKGDMGNLLLTFPNLEPNDFLPWIDTAVATQKGLSVEEYAKKQAELWKKGIQKWHQDSNRIKKLKQSQEIVIYTPGSTTGVPLSVLSSFDVPSDEVLSDSDLYTQVLQSSVSSLLALIDQTKDTFNSKEAILLSNIFNYYWKKGISLTIEELIGAITTPPFKKIGVMELKTFYPQNERLKLAFSLNNIIASPTFAPWMEGENLDIEKLLYDKNQRPKTSILNISHLNDKERMFFVTLFLNKYVAWMRTQRGSSSLRTLLYMDEIFGYFPATKNPPSKAPMLLLLKQARAFGIGIVLSTQNPIDLDYKGLSNIGSWFIGRLQTKQDIQRVIDGLVKAGGSFSKKAIAELLSNMPKRTFLLKSAHREDIELFSTRWVLSYLKGPLNRDDIKLLMDSKKEQYINKTDQTPKKEIKPSIIQTKAELSEDIDEYFYITDITAPKKFQPYLIANGVINYIDSRRNIDESYGFYYKYPLDKDTKKIIWDEGIENEDDFELYEFDYPQDASFGEMSEFIKKARSLKKLEKEWITYLYKENKLPMYRVKKLKMESEVDESLEDFRLRVVKELEEKLAEEKEKLTNRYEKKLAILQRRYQKALLKVQKEQEDLKEKSTSALFSFGMTVLDAFFGTKTLKRSTISKAGSTLKKAGSIYGEKGDLQRAKEALAVVEEEIEQLQYQLEEELDKLTMKYDIDQFEIEEFFIKPKKSNITDVELAILWQS